MEPDEVAVLFLNASGDARFDRVVRPELLAVGVAARHLLHVFGVLARLDKRELLCFAFVLGLIFAGLVCRHSFSLLSPELIFELEVGFLLH